MRFHLHRQQHGPHHHIHSSYKTFISPAGRVGRIQSPTEIPQAVENAQQTEREKETSARWSQLPRGSPQLWHPPWLQGQEEQGKCLLGYKRHPSRCFSGNGSEKQPTIAPDHLSCKRTFLHKLKERRKKTTRS